MSELNGELSLLLDNPRRKRRTHKKRRTAKKVSRRRRAAVTTVIKRRRHRTPKKVVRRRKRYAMAGTTTMGRKRTYRRRRRSAVAGETLGRKRSYRKRRHYTTMGRKRHYKRHTTMGRVRRHKRSLGSAFDIKSIFSDILSAGSVALGAVGGFLTSSYSSSMIFGEKAQDGTTTITYSDSILGGLVSFGALHFIENYMRPSGVVQNLFTGAKVGTMISILMKLKGLFLDGKEWNNIDYLVTKDTTILGKDNNSAATPSRVQGALLGAYLVEDDGTTTPLSGFGASRIVPNTMLGASRIVPNTMLGATDSYEVNREIDELLSGVGANQSTRMQPTNNWSTFRK